MKPTPGRVVFFWPHERCDEPMVCIITRSVFDQDKVTALQRTSDWVVHHHSYNPKLDERCYAVYLRPIYDPGVHGALAYGDRVLPDVPCAPDPKHKHWTWPPRV
jgi:hypothetical protein